MKRTFYLYVGSWMMRIFIHPSPENLDSEAILRLVAVTQSGAYLVYVSISNTSVTKKSPRQTNFF